MTIKRLGELLVSKNIITSAQLDEALAEQRRTNEFLGNILIKRGFAKEDEIVPVLSEQLGFAYVDLSKYKLEPAVVQLLSEEAAKRHRAIPILKGATAVTVAMANPLDVNAVDELKRLIKTSIRPVFAQSSQILNTIEEEYHKDAFSLAAKDMEAVNLAGMDSVQIASLAPVVNIVDNLFAKAVELGASDIHLEPQAENFYCRFRIDGVLHDMPKLPKRYEAAITSRIKIMSGMDIAEKRLPQDGRIQTAVANKNVDLRISTFPTMYGETMVIRILDKSRSMMQLEDLGMIKENLKTFQEMIYRPHGIILVTGPTGSGKTTTLYSGLTKINTIDRNIVTMEDPIEYEIERVCQSQVNVKAGLTFATGLRSLVRQDPDVIMIGEIRDHETAEIAIHAALTGHLVLSTLHTNNAPAAAARLIDMGVEPFLVSSALICVAAQRLVRVLCPHCKEEYMPTPEVLAGLGFKKPAVSRSSLSEPGGGGRVEKLAGGVKFYREKGCRQCHETGYSGRIGIYEFLVPDDDIKRLIERKASASEIRDCAVRKGMKTLRDDGIAKVIQGATSVSELLRVTHDN